MRNQAESGLRLVRNCGQHRVTPRIGSNLTTLHTNLPDTEITRAPRGKALFARGERENLRARREARRFQKREPPGLQKAVGVAKIHVGGLHHQMSIEG